MIIYLLSTLLGSIPGPRNLGVMWTYGPATLDPRFPSRFHSSNSPRLLGSTGYTWSSFGTDDGDTLRWWCTWKMGRFKTTSNVRISGMGWRYGGWYCWMASEIPKKHDRTKIGSPRVPRTFGRSICPFVAKRCHLFEKNFASFKLGCDVNLPHFQGGKWRFRFRWVLSLKMWCKKS